MQNIKHTKLLCGGEGFEPANSEIVIEDLNRSTMLVDIIKSIYYFQSFFVVKSFCLRPFPRVHSYFTLLSSILRISLGLFL